MGSCMVTGNLGCENQSRRLRMGVMLFATALAVAVVVLKLDLAAPFRLALFIPFGIAANGVYMGLFKT